MTKLVRKLKQMAKKRAHRNSVQKRKVERAQRELQRQSEQAEQRLEYEVDAELARLQGDDDADHVAAPSAAPHVPAVGVREVVRVVGGLVLDTPRRKNKRQLSRKQQRRKEKLVERAEAVAATLERKYDHKRRSVKVRAQVRNEDLHN